MQQWWVASRSTSKNSCDDGLNRLTAMPLQPSPQACAVLWCCSTLGECLWPIYLAITTDRWDDLIFAPWCQNYHWRRSSKWLLITFHVCAGRCIVLRRYISVCEPKVGRPASELMSPAVTVMMVVMTARGDTHNCCEIRNTSRNQSQ